MKSQFSSRSVQFREVLYPSLKGVVLLCFSLPLLPRYSLSPALLVIPRSRDTPLYSPVLPCCSLYSLTALSPAPSNALFKAALQCSFPRSKAVILNLEFGVYITYIYIISPSNAPEVCIHTTPRHYHHYYYQYLFILFSFFSYLSYL